MTRGLSFIPKSCIAVIFIVVPLCIQAGEPTVSPLYKALCLSCHGKKGDGNGPLGRFLVPLPRDFGSLNYRLVSTINGVASTDDLFKTITDGIPGTSMPGMQPLSIEERVILVHDVQNLARARWIHLHPDASYSEVLKATTPGKKIKTEPPWPTYALLKRGRNLYRQNCVVCHGLNGEGDGPLATQLLDDRKDPINARNFRKDPFKGGKDQVSIFLRLRIGMPGTPMPAFNLPDEDLWAVVYFIEREFLTARKD